MCKRYLLVVECRLVLTEKKAKEGDRFGSMKFFFFFLFSFGDIFGIIFLQTILSMMNGRVIQRSLSFESLLVVDRN